MPAGHEENGAKCKPWVIRTEGSGKNLQTATWLLKMALDRPRTDTGTVDTRPAGRQAPVKEHTATLWTKGKLHSGRDCTVYSLFPASGNLY